MATPNTDIGPKPDMSNVPPAVRRAAEEADRLHKEEITRRQGGEPSPAPAPAPAAAGGDPTSPLPAPNTPPPAPVPAPAAPEAPLAGKMSYEELEHALRSEQGRTRQMRNEIAGLADQMADMRKLVATLKTEPTPPAAPAAPKKIEWTKEEIEEWGEAFPVIEKKVQEALAPLEMQFRDAIGRVGHQVDSVAQVTVQNARDRMIAALDGNKTINPASDRDWRAINGEEDFVEWLKFPDGLSGRKRHDMLMEAWNSNDASRVAAFFESFLKEAALVAPREPAPQPGAPPAPSPAPALEQFAAPGRPRTAAPVPPGGPAADEIITTGDITRYYNDVAAGRWRGREAEAKEYEAKIFKAQRENRIRPGNPQP